MMAAKQEPLYGGLTLAHLRALASGIRPGDRYSRHGATISQIWNALPDLLDGIERLETLLAAIEARAAEEERAILEKFCRVGGQRKRRAKSLAPAGGK